MDPINALAAKHGLVVIEDAAQSQGARYKGRRVGSLGHAAATSFYPGKNLGTLGDGGALLTSDDVIADKIKQLRNYGSIIKYQHDFVGFNSRLDEMQAAFPRAKLGVLESLNKLHREVASKYSKALNIVDDDLRLVPEFADPVWHLYVIRSSSRDKLQKHLEQKGVGTVIHYPIPPHRQECYSNYKTYNLPIADKLSNEVLSLPISPAMNSSEIEYICNSIINL